MGGITLLFCEEFSKNEDGIKFLKKKNATDRFIILISDFCVECDILTLSSAWPSLKSSLLPSDFKDARLCCKETAEKDKCLIFSDYAIKFRSERI